MKIKNYLLAGLAALSMASCSDDDLSQNGPQIAEKDGRVYMKVSIANPKSTGTKALSDDPKFDNGTKAESAVKKILFAFYNQAGNYVGQSTMTWSETPSGDLEFGGDMPNQGTGSNVETELTMVVPVDVNAGGYLPYYVMAYVNPAASDQANAANLDETSILKREASQYVDGSKNFVMNNSVYYASTSASKPVFATQIKKLSETKTDANKDETPTTEIYVERICAKVTVKKDDKLGTDLDMNAGTEIPGAISGDTKIAFHPVNWALNATAKESYLVKQFRNTPDAAPVSYTTVNNRFMTLKPSWNDATNLRSYWCTGYAYAFDNYPKVASQANAADIPVTYYSYNNIKDNGFGWGTSTYCLEHTVTNAGAPLAAYTSVIVTGYYTLGDNTTATTFYTYGTSDNKPVVYTENDKLVAEMVKASNPVCTDDKGTALAENFSSIYEVKRPADVVIGGILVPSRYVYLQVKESVATGQTAYYFRSTDGTYKQISSTTLTEVNRMLMSSNPATKYNEGMAYYNIPIEQFGLSTADNKVAYGSYGVVRNHSYVINIQGISGLGTGIADPTDPIIPPTEQTTYYVKTKLNVLAWRVMANQDVTLGGE